MKKNSIKARSGVYISNRVNYTRQTNLEGIDSHLVIIDIEGKSDINRIINVYRCFNPEGNTTAREKFRYQLNLIKIAMKTKTAIIGDFNIDFDKLFDDNYAHRNLFDDFDEILNQ